MRLCQQVEVTIEGVPTETAASRAFPPVRHAVTIRVFVPRRL